MKHMLKLMSFLAVVTATASCGTDKSKETLTTTDTSGNITNNRISEPVADSSTALIKTDSGTIVKPDTINQR